jgi:hypothetical protein
VHGPFFFTETTVTGNSLFWTCYWLLPQLNSNDDDYIHHLDGAPNHFHMNVLVLLSRVLPQHWIGRAANGDNIPFARFYTMRVLSLGVRKRQRLCTTIAHIHPGTS